MSRNIKHIIATLIFITLIIILNKQVKSQEYKNIPIIKNNIHAGMIINNYIYFDDFPKREPALLNEFYFGHKHRGSEEWHEYYGFPETGISFITGSLGNKKEFGNTLGLIPSMTLKILKSKSQNIRITLGIGLAYNTTPFDSVSNPNNILIGSRITNMSFVKLHWERKITNKLVFNTGIALFHCSNGHYQIPNVGLNMPTGYAGINYLFSNDTEIYKRQNKTRTKNPIKLNVQFGLGVHELAWTAEPVGTPKYNIYTFSLFASKRIGIVNNYITGISCKYYTSYHNYIVQNDYLDGNEHLKSLILTYFIGDEFIIGNFAMFFQAGINFYFPFTNKYFKENYNKVFQRHSKSLVSTKLGLKYYFLKHKPHKSNFFIALAIKANFGQADFPEISLGYVF